MAVQDLPLINAILNGLATVFLFSGWLAIKKNLRDLHRKLMVSAFLTSALFLSCYLYYHFNAQVMTTYPGSGAMKWLYYFILATHVPIATLMVPFIFAALYQAQKGNFEKHKKIVRWLWPAWMYVSITGVLIYLMLYVFVG